MLQGGILREQKNRLKNYPHRILHDQLQYVCRKQTGMAFNPLDTIMDFLEPVNRYLLSDDEGYKHNQLGSNIDVFEDYFPDVAAADLVLVGCGENRGAGGLKEESVSADLVRREFYSLFHWHKDVKVADVGNVKPGATMHDTYAALKTVVAELLLHAKRVVIIGGSHDLTYAQYQVYAAKEKIVEAVCVDAMIDMNMDSVLPAPRRWRSTRPA